MKKILAKGRNKKIILGMVLVLCGLMPSPFLWAQKADSTYCKKGEDQFFAIDFKTKPDSSILLLEKGLAYFENGQCWEEYVSTLNRIGAAYYYKKDYILFSDYTRQATEYADRYLGKESSVSVEAIANHGISTYLLGNFKKSIQLQLQSLNIELGKKNPGKKLPILLENLGSTYLAIGDFELARDYFEQTLKWVTQNKGVNRHDIGRLQAQIASCYREMHQIENALKYYDKSLTTLEKLEANKFFDQTKWYAYQELAELHLELGHLEEAFFYIGKTFDIPKQKDMLETYKSYLTLGDIQLQANKTDQALSSYLSAGQSAEEEYQLYERHHALSKPVAHQAKLYAFRKEYLKALQHYDQALELITLDDDQYTDHLLALDILEGRGKVYYNRYLADNNSVDLKKSLSDYQALTEVLQSIRQSYFSEDSKQNVAERAVPIVEQGITTALELHRISNDPIYLEEAFSFAESNKAALLHESLQEEVARGFAGIPDSLLEQEESLRSELSFLKRTILEAKQKKEQEDLATIQKWEGQVFDLEKEYRDWIAQQEKQYPLYYNRKYQTEPTSIQDLRAEVLPPNSAIVEFMIGPKQSYAFFLSQKKLQAFPIGDSQSLLATINALRKEITTRPANGNFKENYTTFTQNANKLYQRLLEKGLKDLDKEVNHLVIIPDDVLSLLPFELLLQAPAQSEKVDYAPQNLAYLFEDYTLSYHYSSTLMAALQSYQNPQEATESFIGFAPSFGNKQIAESRACVEGSLYNLQHNGEEVLAIKKLLGGEALLAEEARLTTFQKDAPNYQIVHLATHACVNEDHAALSKIYFTDSNLTPLELNNLHFGADLTVLSACNTGSGKILKGEGVMSLARSFMLAGSQSVLTSLWSVDDRATSDIMIYYYEGLKEGLSKDRALGRAKLSYLAAADRYNRHPSYWAAFVQFGKVEAIDFSGNKTFFFLKLIALFLLLGFIIKISRSL